MKAAESFVGEQNLREVDIHTARKQRTQLCLTSRGKQYLKGLVPSLKFGSVMLLMWKEVLTGMMRVSAPFLGFVWKFPQIDPVSLAAQMQSFLCTPFSGTVL